jgi:hypothetical protein
LKWSISFGTCTSFDNVTVTFNQFPTTADAGPDQIDCGLTTVTLAGNTPTIGTGSWTIVSGTGGSFGNASSSTSTFTGVAGNSYTLRWTITNAPCVASSDDVVITFNQNPVANAGPDQTGAATCGLTTVTLAGNTPAVGTGLWTIVTGAGGAINNPTSPTSTFTGTAGTAYTLRWTVTNAPCPDASDDVNITFNQNPTPSVAGPAQSICLTTGNVVLAANTPVVGTGTWSVVSGPSLSSTQFSSVSNPAATFTPGGGAGTYVLRWTIANAPCTASISTVSITVSASPTVANAGIDKTTCGTSVSLTGNTPAVGTGTWSVVTGPAGYTFGNINSGTSTFSNNSITNATTYTLRWTISNGACPPTSDDVNVTFYPPIANNIIYVQSICREPITGLVLVSLSTAPPGISGGDGTYTYIWEQSCTGTSSFVVIPGSGPSIFVPQGGNNCFYRRTAISPAWRRSRRGR